MNPMHDRESFDTIGTLIRAIPTLSPAELRVALLLLEYRSTKEIADRLSRSARTIENHRYSIRKKMGARADLTIELMRVRTSA